MSTCKINEWFPKIKCQLAPMESNSDGFCILHSRNINKNKSAFKNALQDKLSQEDYDFRMVFFIIPIFFNQKKFKKYADFSSAKFLFFVEFKAAVFLKGANFSYTIFNSYCDFQRAIFSGHVKFELTQFYSDVNFNEATISGQTIFSHVNEHGTAVLSKPLDPLAGNFQRLNILGELRFEYTSMAKSSFLDTDLRRIRFHNVTWPKYHRRRAIYDEMSILKIPLDMGTFLFKKPILYVIWKEEWLKVGKLYRYLKLNYEEEGDFKQSGDFHYGEMEMHRKFTPFRRASPFSLYFLYWVLSGYGEKPFRAFICIILFLFTFVALLHWQGLTIKESGGSAGLGDVLIYILQKVTFQRPEWANPDSFCGNLLIIISIVVLPGQVALFLLALRNRLGRRR